ncbi:MAG TPA: hypothetical protein VLH86_00295 [Patescibacteria group bacterium]|nr:hypothetical protein [Patescibacteria group bacterium]
MDHTARLAALALNAKTALEQLLEGIGAIGEGFKEEAAIQANSAEKLDEGVSQLEEVAQGSNLLERMGVTMRDVHATVESSGVLLHGLGDRVVESSAQIRMVSDDLGGIAANAQVINEAARASEASTDEVVTNFVWYIDQM